MGSSKSSRPSWPKYDNRIYFNMRCFLHMRTFFHSFHLSWKCLYRTDLMLWCWKITSFNMQCEAEHTEHYLRSFSKRMWSTGGCLSAGSLSEYTGHLILSPCCLFCVWLWAYTPFSHDEEHLVVYIGQAFHYYSENAFYVFNQQIYIIIWYLLDHASLI